MLKLRKRVAELNGNKSFAEYQCVDRVENVMELLENVWESA